ARRRIEDGRSQRGKIASALGGRRHRRQNVRRRAPSSSAPTSEEKRFISAIENFRNIQRAADVRSKVQLVVIRSGQRIPIQRKRPCIQRGSIVIKIHVAVRLVHIEAASHAPERDGPAAARASSKSSATTTGAARATESILLRAIAKFLNAV